jgi:hypothetical protein
VCPIVLVDGTGFAVGAEIRIVAHGTFVPIPDNVGSCVFGLAERSITIDTVMLAGAGRWGFDGFINRDEAMTWVYEASVRDAV